MFVYKIIQFHFFRANKPLWRLSCPLQQPYSTTHPWEILVEEVFVFCPGMLMNQWKEISVELGDQLRKTLGQPQKCLPHLASISLVAAGRQHGWLIGWIVGWLCGCYRLYQQLINQSRIKWRSNENCQLMSRWCSRAVRCTNCTFVNQYRRAGICI